MNFPAEAFHFLRPAWLWALLLVVPFAWSLRRRTNGAGPWERICDAHLLRHLVANGTRAGARGTLALLAIGWTTAVLALAGPAWERLPQQTFREPARTVFVLGLGDSMNGRDVRPSRLARARHKLLDAVGRSAGGSVGLVVYREEAFAVTPLTDDAHVLAEAIPLLETRLMPGRGAHPARGIDEARRLLEPVGVRGARIVLVTDGADDDPSATESAIRAATDAGARVSMLAVAGETEPVAKLARADAVAWAPLAIDDTDLDQILPRDAVDPTSGVALTKSDVQADDWKDMGAWLLWIPLALAPFAFRRGWAAAVLALLCVHLAPGPAQASGLDLFERPDQQGARAFAEGRFAESARRFQDPAWQAAARYRAGDFAGAAAALAAQPDPRSQYNLGNALARSGKLEDAVAAYDRALAAAPGDEDARFNRDLVKKLLEEQQQPSKDGASDSKQDSGDSKSGSSDSKSDPKDSQKQDGSNAQGDASDAKQPSPQAQDGSSGANGEAKSAGDASDESKAAQQAPKPSDATAGQQGDPDDRHGVASDGEQRDEQGAGGSASPQAASNDARERAGQAVDPGDAGELPRDGDATGATTRPLSPQEQQKAQWMARLPDDPGGLLREKIRRDYLRKQAARRGEDGS